MSKSATICAFVVADVAPQIISQRSSAEADNLRNAFRGQSRSPNMIPFDRLSMVSY